MQRLAEMKVADSFNQAGKNKSERENQGDAVMRTAETHQGVRRITETQQGSANFEIKIGLVAARDVGIAQVGNRRQKRESGCQKTQGPRSRRPPAEKLGASAP